MPELKIINEASEAIKRIDRIIWEWEENWIDSREAIELLVPDLKKIICYFKRIQDNVEELSKSGGEQKKRCPSN